MKFLKHNQCTFIRCICAVLSLYVHNYQLALVCGLTQRIQRSWHTGYSRLSKPLSLHNVPKQNHEVTRVQRGDQGPDDTGDISDNIQIINTVSSSSFSRVDQLRGPNVCRSGGKSACCSGWSQRGRSGLCLVPLCNEGSCGQRGRCIKPGLCMCEGGNISPQCRGVTSIRPNENQSNYTSDIGFYLPNLPLY